MEKGEMVGPVYHIQCEDRDASFIFLFFYHRGSLFGTRRLNYDSYIGETEGSIKIRFQEHCRHSSVTSEVSQHVNIDQSMM